MLPSEPLRASLPLCGELISIQAGRPRTARRADGREWRSAILKTPVEGRILLHRDGVDGDRQSDRRHHGGPEKAICCYSSEYFPDWNLRFCLEIGPGGFGENFTTRGLLDELVCLGDIFRVGTAVVQVSQTRVPCHNIANRWEREELPGALKAVGHTGYYLRVLEEGHATAGDNLQLQERPHPDWTVRRTNRVLFDDASSLEELAQLVTLEALSEETRPHLKRWLSQRQSIGRPGVNAEV